MHNGTGTQTPSPAGDRGAVERNARCCTVQHLGSQHYCRLQQCLRPGSVLPSLPSRLSASMELHYGSQLVPAVQWLWGHWLVHVAASFGHSSSGRCDTMGPVSLRDTGPIKSCAVVGTIAAAEQNAGRPSCDMTHVSFHDALCSGSGSARQQQRSTRHCVT